MTKITIAARGSKLSLAYMSKVKQLLIQNNSELKEGDIESKTIKTSGDIHQNIKLSEIGGKNLFCKEIEESLLADKIDIAIHSLKDMESIENSELIIGAYIKRNDCRDVIISDKIKNISDLKKGAIIGSSSRRRELQLKKISEKISIINIRGNIDTRIKKLEENKLDGVILAAAGIKSLNLNKFRKSLRSNEEEMPKKKKCHVHNGQADLMLLLIKKSKEVNKEIFVKFLIFFENKKKYLYS